jgi:cell pole-organizing protein PopZ
MPQTQLQPEPSMEEILASIRRIISEEETGAAESVLDLTQTAPPDDAQAGEDLLVFDTEPQPPAPPPRAARAEAAPPYAQPLAPQPPQPAEPIVSSSRRRCGSPKRPARRSKAWCASC